MVWSSWSKEYNYGNGADEIDEEADLGKKFLTQSLESLFKTIQANSSHGVGCSTPQWPEYAT